MSDRRKNRRGIEVFRLILVLGDDTYTIVPLTPKPAVAKKAFRLRKQTKERNTYDVCLTNSGPSCNCKGFHRWHRCKHVRALKAARLLD